MSMSTTMKRVYDFATKKNESFTAYDFSPDKAVLILHEDGTSYWFENSFALTYYDKDHGDEGACEHPGQWLLVFTEHHGYHVFHLDDLIKYSAWELQEIRSTD